MSESENAKSVIEAVANNPKVATTVSLSTASLGAAVNFGVIQGWLSVVAMAVGIVTSIVVLGIQMIRLERAIRERAKWSGE